LSNARQSSATTLPVRRRMLPLLLALLLPAVLVLTGCIAASAPDAASPPVPELPASGAAPAIVAGPVRIDRSCTTDADCTVKDVGNCCGYYPACVNVDSPTDPAAVRAQCAKDGRASVCGFPAISHCQCVARQCQGTSKKMLN
jgi:hypothetical protein